MPPYPVWVFFWRRSFLHACHWTNLPLAADWTAQWDARKIDLCKFIDLNDFTKTFEQLEIKKDTVIYLNLLVGDGGAHEANGEANEKVKSAGPSLGESSFIFRDSSFTFRIKATNWCRVFIFNFYSGFKFYEVPKNKNEIKNTKQKTIKNISHAKRNIIKTKNNKKKL